MVFIPQHLQFIVQHKIFFSGLRSHFISLSGVSDNYQRSRGTLTRIASAWSSAERWSQTSRTGCFCFRPSQPRQILGVVFVNALWSIMCDETLSNSLLALLKLLLKFLQEGEHPETHLNHVPEIIIWNVIHWMFFVSNLGLVLLTVFHHDHHDDHDYDHQHHHHHHTWHCGWQGDPCLRPHVEAGGMTMGSMCPVELGRYGH